VIGALNKQHCSTWNNGSRWHKQNIMSKAKTMAEAHKSDPRVHVAEKEGISAAVAHTLRCAPATVRSVEQEKLVADIAEMGAKIVIATVAAGDMYFRLCEYIRKHSVAKQLVYDSLEPLSFTKPRISEIYRVASASDDVWREFEARKLGFTKALNLTRGTLKLLLSKGEQEEKSTWLGAIPEDGTDAGLDGGGDKESKGTSAAEAGVKAKATPLDDMEAAARKLARAAEDAGLRRPRTWVMENGFEVRVRKVKVAVSADKGAEVVE